MDSVTVSLITVTTQVLHATLRIKVVCFQSDLYAAENNTRFSMDDDKLHTTPLKYPKDRILTKDLRTPLNSTFMHHDASIQRWHVMATQETNPSDVADGHSSQVTPE